MHIIFLNGSEFRGTWPEFTRALLHPLFVALILVMTTLIFVTGPYDHILPEAVIARTLVITSAVAVFLTFTIFCFSRCARANWRAVSILVFIPANIVTSIWAVTISTLAGGTALGVMGWAQLLTFNFIFFAVGELVFVSFLLPRVALETGLEAHPIVILSPAARMALTQNATPDEMETQIEALTVAPDSPEQDEGPEPQQQLEILGQPVALDQIWHLKAEEHYVLLGLRDGTSHLLRGRLADAIAQVPVAAGLQVHRSHWVARAALADLDRKRDGWRLRLHNGTDIPVARNRQTEVRSWVEAVLIAA